MAKKSKKSKNSKPLVSVIIPVRSVSYFLLFENLPKMDEQVFKRFEVIVLPNEHTTYDITLMNTYPWLRIIPTGGITRPAQKRDIGVQNAKGKIIAFIDDDAYPDNQWLASAIKLFKRRSITVVCGPGSLPKITNNWEKVFDLALSSWLGSGKYSYRFIPKRKRFVLDYPSMNFLIYKKIFLDLGGFNSNYWPGEDSKLCNDIVMQKKGKILYDPNVLVYHHRRQDLKGFLRQHSQYGFHRGAFFSHGDRNSREFSYLIPPLFTLYICILPLFYLLFWFIYAAPVIYMITIAPLLLYGLLLVVVFIQFLVISRNILLAGGASLVLLVMHFWYGLYFWKGLQKGSDKQSSIYG